MMGMVGFFLKIPWKHTERNIYQFIPLYTLLNPTGYSLSREVSSVTYIVMRITSHRGFGALYIALFNHAGKNLQSHKNEIIVF
jgi:hypothetical protein